MDISENNIIVTGASGMLGTELVRLLRERGGQVLEADAVISRDGQVRLDITDSDAVAQLISRFRPRVVYNCAAFTDVDGAERKEELALKINGQGTGNLAKACRDNGAFFVHVSTDYVFDGNARQPYMPDSPTGPQTAYGRSKLAGEQQIQGIGGKWLIVRTSWLFGREGKNFVDSIVGLAKKNTILKVVDDQKGCPTYAPDLAHCLVDLAGKGLEGIYHFCNGPSCSWYEMAQEAIQIAGIKCEVQPCVSSEYPRPAKRPSYSVLDCEKTYQELDWKVPGWQEAVRKHISQTEGVKN